MLDLVGNPEDQFSRFAAHIMIGLQSKYHREAIIAALSGHH